MNPTTEVIRSASRWKEARLVSRAAGRTLGFVPTMGALHEGHLSLVRKSRAENDLTLVSIFVNPTQFNDLEDLRNYPRDLERDLALLRAEGVDAVLAPAEAELYADGYRYRVSEGELSRGLCGAHRAGHFDGVLTVVLKLLMIADADRAYFGEKDFQQLDLIRGMAEAFFLGTRIVGCPIVREEDGLAMSSRNALLTPLDRARAPGLRRALAGAETPDAARAVLEGLGFKVDYVEERETGYGLRRFGAARLGGVRLIDNVAR